MKTKGKMLPVLLTVAVLMTMTVACGSPDNAPSGSADGVVADAGKEGPKETEIPSKETETPSKEGEAVKENEAAAGPADIESEAKAAGQTIVYAATTQELQDALKSNTMIVLEGKDYTYEYGLNLMNLENMTIHGTEGTRIMTTSESDDIINFQGCKGMMLRNLVMGHDVPVESECSEGVVYAFNSEVTLVNCDIFGCGLLGIEAGESTITAKNTTIRDCEYGFINFYNSGAVFENCTFSGCGNGYSQTAIILSYNEKKADVLFSGCRFTDNQIPNLYTCTDSKNNTEIDAITFQNCTYSGNDWGDTAP